MTGLLPHRNLGGREPGESEADWMDRKLREEQARWKVVDARIVARRAAETPAAGYPDAPGDSRWWTQDSYGISLDERRG